MDGEAGTKGQGGIPLGWASAEGPRPALPALPAPESLGRARWGWGLPQWGLGDYRVMVWQGLGVSSAWGSDSCKSPGGTEHSVQSEG